MHEDQMPRQNESNRMLKFEIYPVEDGWRWRLLSRSGDIIALGGSYKNRVDCAAAISRIKHGAVGARVETVLPQFSEPSSGQ